MPVSQPADGLAGWPPAALTARNERRPHMLVDDANKLASDLTERISSGAAASHGVTATVKVDKLRPESVPGGAGRPTFSRYFVIVEDPSRVATLILDDAGSLLDDFDPSWDADAIFDAIRARDVEVEAKQ